MKRPLVTLAVSLSLLSCAVGADRAIRSAESSGLSDVVASGSAWLACSNSDMMLGQTIQATNAAGQRVTATVCCGVLKACTVRFR